MNTATRIIEKFGTGTRLAELLGLPATTVRSWRISGYVPAKHQAAVINAGRKAGVMVAPDDFFEDRRT